MKSIGRTRQTGMAVIAALLVVIAASIAAVAVIERQTLLAQTLTGERNRAQAEWLLRGGLDWARVILREDARRNATTRLDTVWAQPIAGLRVSDPDDAHEALFSGRIEDEQGKYNLRNLINAKGEIVPEELEALTRLLSWLDMPAELAAALAQRIADATPGEEPAQAPGVRSVTELGGIDDLSAERMDVLQAYVTVLPGPTPINANTASAEVLASILPELSLAVARELVAERDRGLWFNSAADLFNRVKANDGRLFTRIAVRSDWFRVSGEVAMSDAVVGVRALLHRRNDQAPVIRWMTDR
ncbi:type II secretion system minor pseudopilin GspK [Thauera aromatica]|uniref:type II secretion system minor pseudopilin GspK n=1 Tax=Thauera aromatica TaxID=59405 RepID=UPI001FFCC89C|nr:type II secretion system minor pseudopilin GspK [Thauera aromatica]MCK2094557.1 type II secretion system minor pseudopilin GspK [Thauera aromatica]